MKELGRGETAEKLFDTYTLTANPPEPGAFLELSIVVQAYDKNDIQNLWPSAAVAQIEN